MGWRWGKVGVEQPEPMPLRDASGKLESRDKIYRDLWQNFETSHIKKQRSSVNRLVIKHT
jgi:hypothetical protein